MLGTSTVLSLVLSVLNLQLSVAQIPVAHAQTPVPQVVSQQVIPIPIQTTADVVPIPTEKKPVKVIPAVLHRIAKCEGGTQFDKKGNVVRGRVNSHDIGKWQINEDVWGKTAKKLGYNIYSLEGN